MGQAGVKYDPLYVLISDMRLKAGDLLSIFSQILSMLTLPISALEYWGVGVLCLIWQLGLLHMSRELLLSLLAPDYVPSKRRSIYRNQPLHQRLSLLFLKDKIITYRKLFTPYYILYLGEAALTLVYLICWFLMPLFLGYRYLLFGIYLILGIISTLFYLTKYPHGFRCAPKYSYPKKENMETEHRT